MSPNMPGQPRGIRAASPHTQIAHMVPLPRPWRAATSRQEVWSHLCPLSLHLFFTIPQGLSCTPEPGSSLAPRASQTRLSPPHPSGSFQAQRQTQHPGSSPFTSFEFSETSPHYRQTYFTKFSEMHPVYSVWASKLSHHFAFLKN